MHLIIHAKKMRDINRSAKIFDGFFEVVSCLLFNFKTTFWNGT